MSLRHLYLDLKDLGIYPDVTYPSITEDDSIITFNHGKCHLNRYYGSMVSISGTSDGYHIHISDMLGRLHNTNGPAELWLSGNIEDVKHVVRILLTGRCLSCHGRWYFHGKQLINDIPDNMFMRLYHDITLDMRISGTNVIINNEYVVKMTHSYHTKGCWVTFNEETIAIEGSDKKMWLTYDNKIIYEG